MDRRWLAGNEEISFDLLIKLCAWAYVGWTLVRQRAINYALQRNLNNYGNS